MVQQPPANGTSATAPKPKVPLSGGAIASLIGAGLVLIVVFQNTEDVTIDFLFWSFDWPLWLFAIVMVLLGALVWFGLGVMRRHRRRKARRS
jgi:uncharacterized integral membrane protein